MKIGVLSDTHDQDELIRKAVQQFNEEQVAWVFHCGDWVSPSTTPKHIPEGIFYFKLYPDKRLL
jgi:uncharacterized protein